MTAPPFTRYGYPPEPGTNIDKDWGTIAQPTSGSLGMQLGSLNPALFDASMPPMVAIRNALVRFRKGDTSAPIVGTHRATLKNLFGIGRDGVIVASEQGWEVS